MMKKSLIYICAAAAMLAACDDDFTRPPLVLPPTVQVEPTTTVLDFKTEYWNTISAGPATIGTTGVDGDSVIFVGRVCSSDETGNIYKNIVVQSKDSDGRQVAITFSVNAYDIYQSFPFGQEVAVYATGLNIGGYRGLLQFGAVSGSEMTFMAEDLFKEHVIRTGKGLPEPEKVDTTATTIAELNAVKADNASLMLWQSRLVRVDGVSFVEAGQPFAGAQSVSRYITDENGGRMIVRNSSYASFSDKELPYGTGSVVGILSYYGSDWQILLIDDNGCIGFDGVAPEPDPSTEPSGNGTPDDPYNVAAALKAINDNTITEDKVYVKGKISRVTEVSTSFGNATYFISDNGNTSDELGVFRGYWLGGERFTSENQIEAGAEVVVYGQLMNYMGNTPQMAQGNSLVTYNGQGGDTPNPPAGDAKTIFSALGENLSEMPSDWTIENVNLASGLTGVWSWKTYNEKGYLNASAYDSAEAKAKASEAYAISPEIDLTGATGCTLSFEHAAKFQTTLRTLCGVVAREAGTTAWTALTVVTWPEAGAWTFANSGEIDLSAFDGKKIQVAFKYASTDSGADTWEIKNLKVNGVK